MGDVTRDLHGYEWFTVLEINEEPPYIEHLVLAQSHRLRERDTLA